MLNKLQYIFLFTFALMFVFPFIATSDNETTSQELMVECTVLPALKLSIDTYNIDFGTISGLQSEKIITEGLKITVQSNTNYKFSMMGDSDFTCSDPVDSFPISYLMVKLSNETDYKTMSKTEEVVLADNQPATAESEYSVDLKLMSGYTTKTGNYHATLRIFATQL